MLDQRRDDKECTLGERAQRETSQRHRGRISAPAGRNSRLHNALETALRRREDSEGQDGMRERGVPRGRWRPTPWRKGCFGGKEEK